MQQPRRARTRRNEIRPYTVQPAYVFEGLPDPADPATTAAELLCAAGSLASALRPAARKAGIAPRFTRLLLAFPQATMPMNVSDLAWRLGITTGGATRLLDAAEERALIDKMYTGNDRRATLARLAPEGRRQRSALQEILRAGVETNRRIGRSYGIRSYLDGFTRPGERRGSRGP